MTLLPPIGHSSSLDGAVPAFVRDLATHGAATALIEGDRELTYADLAIRVDARAAELAGTGTRRLVLVEAANDLDVVITYLACLRAGHPVLLVPPAAGAPERWCDVTDRYDPDVSVTRDGAGRCATTEHRPGSGHELHPELALLLSTSGSTGAPKLVRLSGANLEANAEAIASYLGLRTDDRAITSLPMAYCYGLSVINSHLAAGASILLSDRSVIDGDFWRTFSDQGVTGLAGVPHTVELLERIGFADLHLPALRRITQAGGRLDAELVRRYAALGRRRGWDLFVMYGQTEATARMAYVPPELVETHPTAIGVAVPGGSLRLDGVDGDGVGELVYRGPNVMLGYAESVADLAVGRRVDELRTGDLARLGDGGLFEIVGRRNRFVKPFGLRVDLDQLEQVLRAEGIDAACTGDDRRLVVATTGGTAVAAEVVQRRTGLPPAAVTVHSVAELPRLANGKVDHAAVLALGAERPSHLTPAGPIARLYSEVFARRDVDGDDTFVGLGGDSLSYVELSVRLEDLLGDLPDDWPARRVTALEELALLARPVADGQTMAPPRRRRVAVVETSVALRAAAIVLIVSTHAAVVDLKGGAHLLLAVAGWNFARFQLPVAGRRLATSIGRVAVPTAAWVGFLLLVTDGYGLANLALVHTQVGEAVWDERWRFWFIETLVQALVVIGALAALPPVRRLERRRPFELALGALALALVLRVVAVQEGTVRRPQEVAWFFVLGWVAQRAMTTPQRLLVTAITVGAVPGFFGQPWREVVVIAGITALVWFRSVPVVRPLQRVVALLAASSLAVYLTHWHVYPPVREWSSPALAVLASFAVGITVHAGGRRLATLARRR